MSFLIIADLNDPLPQMKLEINMNIKYPVHDLCKLSHCRKIMY